MESRSERPTWNLFNRRDAIELWCAVPADTAVPVFLFSGDWAFNGQHPEPLPLPEFQKSVALQSVRMNGFYLFQKLPSAA